jgi:hypothetical protein
VPCRCVPDPVSLSFPVSSVVCVLLFEIAPPETAEPLAEATDVPEPGYGASSLSNNDSRDVVFTHRLSRKVHQTVRCLLGMLHACKERGDLCFRDLARQSIGAQQHRVAIHDEFFGNIPFDFRLYADGANENVLQTGIPCRMC